MVLEDNSVEAVVVVGGVLDGTFGTIGLDKAVVAFHDATVSFFVLAFDVAGVFILDVVGEVVFGVGVVIGGFMVLVVQWRDWAGNGYG